MPTSRNELAQSSSPYLQQHKDNPVHWMEWNDSTLAKAVAENKPILLSIGYSACHWCHVMAHESFEDEDVASIMNKHYVNIKVDREERPDIDQIYMEAIQTMGINGGWPLNVFLTPDQKPFYGGTYFPKEGWKKMLLAVSGAYEQNRDKLLDSAEKFTEGLNHSQLSKLKQLPTRPIEVEVLNHAYLKLENRYDRRWGAFEGAPKFPMPGLWSVFESISSLTSSPAPQQHLLLTAQRMYEGGIYDHIGGGFARYSVDPEWHVPHFEKMLYDNAQILSLYAQAYRLTRKEDYLDVLKETIAWLQREMLSSDGGYYSALDADSEGVEGKYYVWTKNEFDKVGGTDADLMADVFDVSESGNWEGVNVLRRLKPTQQILEDHQLTEQELRQLVSSFKIKALEVRSKRIAPGLDSKIISGWNGLLLSGICDTYRQVDDTDFRAEVQAMAEHLKNYLSERLVTQGVLYHMSDLKNEGFSDDYAAVIKGMLDYYETFFDETALKVAAELTVRLFDSFFDEEEGFFFYVNKHTNELIARKKEIYDNVIPSSNALIASSLLRLGVFDHNEHYREVAKTMILVMAPLVQESIQDAYAWGHAAMYLAQPCPEVIIVGPEASSIADQLRSTLPLGYLAATSSTSSLPAYEHKPFDPTQTTIYVCFDRVCQQPTQDLAQAKRFILRKD